MSYRLTLFYRLTLAILLLSFQATGQNIKSELIQLEKKSGGKLGVYAVHIEKGEIISLHDNELFPMASVYKVPIGIYFLHQVFSKSISLSDSATITAENIAPEHSPLTQRWKREGDFTIDNQELLRLMIAESDNTACDIILKLVGGARNVNKYFASMGLVGFSVNRTEKQMALDHIVAGDPSFVKHSPLAIDSILDTFSEKQRTAVLKRFIEDRRDTSTPRGMAELLLRIHKRSLAGFTDYYHLLQLLIETQTGLNRIRAGAPEDAIVAHKTGTHRTIAGVNIATNDAGIIYTPGGKHIVMVVFLKASKLNSSGREKIIADVSRVICERWED
jgi:beta-lactamase class A